MQIQGNISNGVREVEPAQSTRRVRCGSDARHVQPLSCEVLHSAHHDEGDFVATVMQDGLNVSFFYDAASFSWSHLNDLRCRVAAVKADLAGEGVLVGRESLSLAEDFGALPAWSEKTHKE